MNAMELTSGWRRAAGLTLGLGALFVTVACSARDTGVAAQSLTANAAGLPVMVTCEPHQRTLVRPVTVNGATVSQVECVAAEATAAVSPDAGIGQAQPLAPAYQPVVQRTRTQPVYDDLGDARVVSSREPRVVPASQREVVYREPVKQGRSVKKSAIIIGSSAGVGAGVGAAVGGKKGALIGAASGGGGAAIWDQITRRK
jgi:hypothetical protein